MVFNEKQINRLLRNINRQAALAKKIEGLVIEQNALEVILLGDLIPDVDNRKGNADLRDRLAYSVVDGELMTKEELLSILEEAAKQLSEE